MVPRARNARSARIRADQLMVQQALAESREQAQAMIMAGLVRTDTGPVLKAGSPLSPDASLEVQGRLPYVSRGGLKLVHALDTFEIAVSGLIALDVGASTGGFTDCLLQKGARWVYALDVGHGQMAYSLRQDPRVVVMERVNAHHPFSLPEVVELATIDVSFISVAKVIPNVVPHLVPGSPLLVLVKPQFEAKRGEVSRGGVVRDPKVHASVLGRVIVWAVQAGLRVRGLTASPVLGDAGNREFFLLLEVP